MQNIEIFENYYNWIVQFYNSGNNIHYFNSFHFKLVTCIALYYEDYYDNNIPSPAFRLLYLHIFQFIIYHFQTIINSDIFNIKITNIINLILRLFCQFKEYSYINIYLKKIFENNYINYIYFSKMKYSNHYLLNNTDLYNYVNYILIMYLEYGLGDSNIYFNTNVKKLNLLPPEHITFINDFNELIINNIIKIDKYRNNDEYNDYSIAIDKLFKCFRPFLYSDIYHEYYKLTYYYNFKCCIHYIITLLKKIFSSKKLKKCSNIDQNIAKIANTSHYSELKTEYFNLFNNATEYNYFYKIEYLFNTFFNTIITNEYDFTIFNILYIHLGLYYFNHFKVIFIESKANIIYFKYIPLCYDIKRRSGQTMAERNYSTFLNITN